MHSQARESDFTEKSIAGIFNATCHTNMELFDRPGRIAGTSLYYMAGRQTCFCRESIQTEKPQRSRHIEAQMR